jgi:anti-sigma factor RsiW
MSSIEPNDPRLTAYALGELPADEVEAFEALLAEHPEAQAEVDAIRGLADELTEELAKDAPSALDPDTRKAIEEGRPLARVVPLVATPMQPTAKRRSAAVWAGPLMLVAAAAAGVNIIPKGSNYN